MLASLTLIRCAQSKRSISHDPSQSAAALPKAASRLLGQSRALRTVRHGIWLRCSVLPRRGMYLPRHLHWASKEELLYVILNMLPLLRLFSFVPTRTRSLPNEWTSMLVERKSMSVELKSALLRVFTLPSLRICMLEGVQNLPENFSVHSNI
jgi:hypothetical protein